MREEHMKTKNKALNQINDVMFQSYGALTNGMAINAKFKSSNFKSLDKIGLWVDFEENEFEIYLGKEVWFYSKLELSKCMSLTFHIGATFYGDSDSLGCVQIESEEELPHKVLQLWRKYK